MPEDKDIIDNEVIVEFIEDSLESLSNIESLMISLESKSRDKDVIDDIFRMIHTLKGNASILGFLKVKALAHNMEDLIGALRAGNVQINTEIVNDSIRGVDCLKEILENLRENNEEKSENQSKYEECLVKMSSYTKKNL